MAYHSGRCFTVSQKACQGRKKGSEKREKEKGSQVQFSNCSALRNPLAPCWKLNLPPLLGFVSSSVVASISRETAQTASVGDVAEDIECNELNQQLFDLPEAPADLIRLSILRQQAKLALIKGES